MFVPAQPADNSYLPVNMAMITTRNLEFLVLFLFIYLAITIKKINSFKLYFAILTLGILGATDKYFLMLALGASVLEIAYRMLYVKVKPDIKVFYPLISSLGGYVFATLLLAAISKLHITGIPDSAHASPFALTTSVWQMIEAFAGAIQGIIVNFGAGFFGKVASTALLPYAINGTILLICCYAIWKLFFNKKSVQGKNNLRDTRWRFVLWLVLVSIASILLFTASNHEFLKDARYLTSILFAGIGALAYLLQVSSFKNKSLKLLIPIILLALVTPILFIFARANFTQSVNANYSGIGERTDKASNILTKEDADLLVSDYWFSAPTKLKLNKSITIVPMSTDSCDTPNTFLTSKNWIDTSGDVDRSAYYILRDAALDAQTYNHGCTMEYLNQKYGPPEKEYVIRGTTQQPIDIIRIYPYDIRTKF
jgi:hypothetical protein